MKISLEILRKKKMPPYSLKERFNLFGYELSLLCSSVS